MTDEFFEFLKTQNVIFLVEDYNDYIVLARGDVNYHLWSFQADGFIISYSEDPKVIYIVSPKYHHKELFERAFKDYYSFEL